jgi:cleavage and polyadenylation specificity factor subunit 2
LCLVVVINSFFSVISLISLISPLPCKLITLASISKITRWGITKETDRIVYANRFNHRKELHLPKCALDDPKLLKPTLLIVDAYNAGVSVPTRSSNDTKLFDEVIATLRGGGNILIPVDSGSRVLEICLAFDRYWESSKKRGAYNLALLSPLHQPMLEIAKQNLNYMSAELTNQFTKDRSNPFQFNYVHQCSTEDELNEIRGPKVVFATTNTLEYGFGHSLFENWCKNSKNVIIMTERGCDNTLASKLANDAIQKQLNRNNDDNDNNGKKMGKNGAKNEIEHSNTTITFTKRWKVDLEG